MKLDPHTFWNNCGITMVVILGLNLLSFLIVWGVHYAKAMGAKTFKWGKVLESTEERIGKDKWDNMRVASATSSDLVQDKYE